MALHVVYVQTAPFKVAEYYTVTALYDCNLSTVEGCGTSTPFHHSSAHCFSFTPFYCFCLHRPKLYKINTLANHPKVPLVLYKFHVTKIIALAQTFRDIKYGPTFGIFMKREYLVVSHKPINKPQTDTAGSSLKNSYSGNLTISSNYFHAHVAESKISHQRE